MSATPDTLTELGNLAKEYWTDVWTQCVNPATPLKGQLSRLENATFTGKLWIFGTKTAIGGGSANAGGGKSLPPAAAGTYADGQANVVRTYTRMSLDGLLIEVTKSQKGSFRPALAETMSDRLQAHDLEVNRQMYCAADGHLCTIPTGVNSATQTPGTGTGGVAGDYGVVNGGNGMTHVNPGDELAFYQSDGVTLIGRRTVLSVTSTTMTLDSAITTTNGAIVTRATADTDNIAAGEANGLLAAVKDSGVFENIDPATYGQAWKAIVDSNSGNLRDISDTMVMTNLLTVRTRSRQTPDLCVTTPGIVQKYSELLLPIRRIDGLDAPLKGGYKPIAAILTAGGAIPVIDDPDCPKSHMFFLTTSSFRLADVVGTDWADMDGSIFFRVVDMDAIEGYLRKYWNLICVQRNANAVITDINDIDTISRIG